MELRLIGLEQVCGVRFPVFFAGTQENCLRLPVLALALAVSAVWSAPLQSQNWVQSQFFGPHTFTRAEGPQAATTVEFGIPATIRGPFTLTADSTDVTSLRVKLNGVQILDDSQFRGHTSHRIEVHLEASNTLLLEMGGRRGESVTIGISGYQYAQSGQYSGLAVMQAAPLSTAAVEIDWRKKGAVVPVENEGQCSADWAFSAKGAVEGEHAIHKGSLLSLSAQQLVDCGHEFGAQGCSGGLPIDALSYILTYGAVTTSSYPYTARDGTCKRSAAAVSKIGGILRSPVGNDEALLTMLESRGPVSVVIDGNWIPHYRGGIQLNCGSGEPSFLSALLVGALTDGATGEPYWLLKFPYGTAFGEKGYAHLSRRRPNECGITDYAIVPLP
jgi:Papain family cysteine protease